MHNMADHCVIKFCDLQGKTAKQIHDVVYDIYEDVCRLWRCVPFMKMYDIYNDVYYLWRCMTFIKMYAIYKDVWHL